MKDWLLLAEVNNWLTTRALSQSIEHHEDSNTRYGHDNLGMDIDSESPACTTPVSNNHPLNPTSENFPKAHICATDQPERKTTPPCGTDLCTALTVENEIDSSSQHPYLLERPVPRSDTVDKRNNHEVDSIAPRPREMINDSNATNAQTDNIDANDSHVTGYDNDISTGDLQMTTSPNADSGHKDIHCMTESEQGNSESKECNIKNKSPHANVPGITDRDNAVSTKYLHMSKSEENDHEYDDCYPLDRPALQDVPHDDINTHTMVDNEPQCTGRDSLEYDNATSAMYLQMTRSKESLKDTQLTEMNPHVKQTNFQQPNKSQATKTQSNIQQQRKRPYQQQLDEQQPISRQPHATQQQRQYDVMQPTEGPRAGKYPSTNQQSTQYQRQHKKTLTEAEPKSHKPLPEQVHLTTDDDVESGAYHPMSFSNPLYDDVMSHWDVSRKRNLQSVGCTRQNDGNVSEQEVYDDCNNDTLSIKQDCSEYVSETRDVSTSDMQEDYDVVENTKFKEQSPPDTQEYYDVQESKSSTHVDVPEYCDVQDPNTNQHVAHLSHGDVTEENYYEPVDVSMSGMSSTTRMLGGHTPNDPTQNKSEEHKMNENDGVYNDIRDSQFQYDEIDEKTMLRLTQMTLVENKVKDCDRSSKRESELVYDEISENYFQDSVMLNHSKPGKYEDLARPAPVLKDLDLPIDSMKHQQLPSPDEVANVAETIGNASESQDLPVCSLPPESTSFNTVSPAKQIHCQDIGAEVLKERVITLAHLPGPVCPNSTDEYDTAFASRHHHNTLNQATSASQDCEQEYYDNSHIVAENKSRIGDDMNDDSGHYEDYESGVAQGYDESVSKVTETLKECTGSRNGTSGHYDEYVAEPDVQRECDDRVSRVQENMTEVEDSMNEASGHYEECATGSSAWEQYDDCVTSMMTSKIHENMVETEDKVDETPGHYEEYAAESAAQQEHDDCVSQMIPGMMEDRDTMNEESEHYESYTGESGVTQEYYDINHNAKSDMTVDIRGADGETLYEDIDV